MGSTSITNNNKVEIKPKTKSILYRCLECNVNSSDENAGCTFIASERYIRECDEYGMTHAPVYCPIDGDNHPNWKEDK